MTEGLQEGMTAKKAKAPDKTLSVAEVADITAEAFKEYAFPELHTLTILDLLRGAVLSLGYYLKKGKVAGVNWKNPFAQLDYAVNLESFEEGEIEALGENRLKKDAVLGLGKRIARTLTSPDFLVPFVMHGITREVAVMVPKDGKPWLILPPDLEKEVKDLPEAEQEDRGAALGSGFDFLPLSFTGTTSTPAGKKSFTAALVFAVRPLTIVEEQDRAFFPVMVGLDFKEGDPSAWTEEDRQAILDALVGQIDTLAAPYLKAVEAKGEERLDIPKPDRAIPIRAEYFHAPGRLFDTPRNAAKQGDLLAIGRWFMQTTFNRTVGMAAAALTKTDTREAILDWQSATVDEVADLVFCRSEEGTPAHGQNREDILKAFEALRAIPVPIVRIDWKQIGPDRNPRWVKEYKLRVASLLQSYGAVFVEKKTGKRVFAADPGRKKDKVKGKTDRRKTMKELVAQNPADGILESFPPDRFTLTGFDWRWNTDIAEDFICPQVALAKDGRPRLKLKKGRHIEGSRFINLNRRYFAVQKHLREARSTYAPRLLDLIVSEKTHIKSRGKGAVCIEIEAPKVIKWLGLWSEYEDRPKHILEDHIASAVMALIKEKVMLPESWLVPQKDKNPDRRKTDFFRWKVAELWSTVALVTPEEAKDIEAEQVAEAEVAQSQPEPKADQAVLPGMEEPLALPIPDGTVILAARKAAGLNLRRFAEAMDGPSFKTWSMIETGQRSTSAGRIPETVWKRVHAFIEKHGQKADLSHDRQGSVT